MPNDRDIVDEINQLVDEQLQQEASGYDHNINQAKCPHSWCDTDWHGLPIKRRMQHMRDWGGAVDPEYVYAHDDSPIICPGSLFDGAFEPPAPEQQRYGGLVYVPRLSQGLRVALMERLSQPLWPVPELSDELEFPRQYYTTTPDNPSSTSFAERMRQAGYRVTPSVTSWEPEPSPVIDMATVERLGRMMAVAPLQYDTWQSRDDAACERLTDCFEREASRHFLPPPRIHRADMRFTACAQTPDDLMRDIVRVEMRWRPQLTDVEFQGGPRHSETMTVDDVERVPEIRALVPVTVRSFTDFDPTAPILDNTISYTRVGWNTATRRWVYRTAAEPPLAITVRRWLPGDTDTPPNYIHQPGDQAA